jgi:hypothetical protein
MAWWIELLELKNPAAAVLEAQHCAVRSCQFKDAAGDYKRFFLHKLSRSDRVGFKDALTPDRPAGQAWLPHPG